MLNNKSLNGNPITLPIGDPPPYSKHWEQGIPVSLQQGSHDPVILSLLKVIQERNKNSAPNLNRTMLVQFPKMEIPHRQFEIVSVHIDDTTSMKGGPSEKSEEKSEEPLTYCWTCDTPGHLGRPCSSMNKDPDSRPAKGNTLYPHRKKKHVQEMLRKVREQMTCDVETILDNRLTTMNDIPKDGKWTPDIPNENPNTITRPQLFHLHSDRIDLTVDNQPDPTTGSKVNNGVSEDDQTIIHLTDKIDEVSPMKHHNRLPQESCINFSGTINTDTHTIEGHYNTSNSTVLGVPKVVNPSPLDELCNRLNEQPRLLSEQQKVIQGIQSSQN